MTYDEYIAQLSPVLFWDIDREHMDVERHSAGLIQRVLEYGTLQDWRLTRDYYGMDRIVSDCKRLRTLDPMALSFVCAMSHTNKEDYRCYQFRQSNPTPWNSAADVHKNSMGGNENINNTSRRGLSKITIVPSPRPCYRLLMKGDKEK
jgi:hypothetical protein